MRRHLALSAATAVTAACALALTGLAAPAMAADTPVVINEFSASTASTDVEYIELFAAPNAVLSDYRVLHIEGDAPTLGIVDSVIAVANADANGRSLNNLAANTLENGTISLLLVTGAFPTTTTDIDIDNDGIVDESLGLTIVDSIAINDGGTGDLTYGGVTLTGGFDGSSFTPGGASRIPDGTDTGTVDDWARNDFDLAGIPNFAGTPVDGEALNTPGATNALFVPTGPPPATADCLGESLAIGAVQGSGAASPLVGQVVRTEGVVTATFQGTGGLNGYYLQDAGDGNTATSDGIFIYAPGGEAVAVGNLVNVAGSVVEFASAGGSLTEVDASDIEVCAASAPVPAPIPVTLPARTEVRESLEGMYVTFPDSLAILEQFEYARYGIVDVGLTRQMTPTAVAEPGSAEASAILAANLAERITLDDGKGFQNTDPLRHPNGEPFSLTNGFRGGDLLTNITGVLDYRLGNWAVQPTRGAEYAVANPRPEVPEVGGEVTVASFNVLNYFTTLGDRGANTAAEFDRQEAKIVTALAELDADIVGLIEIENNGTAVATLVEALNAVVGAGTYTYIDTGVLGTDAITNALIYKAERVEPLGAFKALDNSIDSRFLNINRPALTQAFAEVGGSEPVTVVVNHLKSKGSDCNAQGDPDTGSGAGNCNIVRTQAAVALADWLATDPTGQGEGRELIIGDLNSYDKEDPIDALRAAGMTDLIYEFEGENAYTYVFDGQLGYLDYALAGTGILEDVTGAAVWRINADEVPALDYNTEFKTAAQVDAFYSSSAFRSSDHDPVLVGLDLTLPDTIAPTITATADPARIFPPNGKDRTVTVEVEASDNSGSVEVELVSATATGNKKAAIVSTTDTTFTVKAAIGSVYTITYLATDAAGNTASASVVVRVGP